MHTKIACPRSRVHLCFRLRKLLPRHRDAAGHTVNKYQRFFLSCTFTLSHLNQSNLKKKNLHLVTSVLVIFPIAFVYGFIPNGFLKEIMHVNADTIDLSSVFRAIMGLYIALAVFWYLGIRKPGYWTAATMSNILCLGGLAVGRIGSLLSDGIPSPVFIAGLFAEGLLAIWGILNLRKYSAESGLV